MNRNATPIPAASGQYARIPNAIAVPPNPVPSADPSASLISKEEDAAIPCQIVIQGGTAEVAAELGDLDLAGLEVAGGYSMIHLTLPTPSGVVPIQIKGGASEITVQHPEGVAIQVTLKGRVNELVFDNQTFREVGNKIRLQGPDFDSTASRYDIGITSYTSKVTITSG